MVSRCCHVLFPSQRHGVTPSLIGSGEYPVKKKCVTFKYIAHRHELTNSYPYAIRTHRHNLISSTHTVSHPPLANNDSTHAGPECPSPQRCSGESIARADYLQSVSGNSRVLDTLGLKSQVVAYDQSSHLLRAVEQLESRARQPLPVHPNVQLEAVPGSTVTSTSIPGACCTPPHSPAIPSHFPAPSLADGCC